MVYLMTNQPLELFRFAMLFLIAILTAQISDSLGMLIASRLSLVVSNSKVFILRCLEFKDFCNKIETIMYLKDRHTYL